MTNPVFASPGAGLCATCRHVQRIDSCRGPVYYKCRKSETDPRFAKYPRMPVVNCAGFQPPPAAGRTPDNG